MRWTQHILHAGEVRNAYIILVGKPEGNRPLGRSRPGWEGNVRDNRREIGREGVDWIQLAQDRIQWRRNETWRSIKGGEFLEQLSDY
jgi:hypothetical protein